jgi:SAM-dependent methyltransferase
MKDKIWQSEAVAKLYLNRTRQAIPHADAQLDSILRIVRYHFTQPQTILDLGCGDGILGRLMLAAFPDTHVVFVDFSEPMLEATRAQLPENTRCDVLKIDYGRPDWIQHLPIPAFDVILSGFSIHHQTDENKMRIYQQIFDLLNPGGLFLNLEHVASRAPWMETIFDDIFIDHLRQAGMDDDREQYEDRPDKHANILALVETQCEWLRDIGFQDVDCFLKTFELALFGGLRRHTTAD